MIWALNVSLEQIIHNDGDNYLCSSNFFYEALHFIVFSIL